MLNAERLWALSRWLYARKLRRTARLVKGLNFLLYKAILPPEANVGRGVRLEHCGLCVVIHPNTTLGHGVVIYHGVTIAAETWIGSPSRVEIGEGVVLGAGAKVVAREDRGLRIGAGAKVGANAVVTSDVAEGQVVVGVPAKPMLRGGGSEAEMVRLVGAGRPGSDEERA